MRQRVDAVGQSVVLLDVLFKGMLRELLEESQVRRGESVEGSQYVTGHFRWFTRGAKPEFTGVVRLNVTLADFERRWVKSGRQELYRRTFRENCESAAGSRGNVDTGSGRIIEALSSQLPGEQQESLERRAPNWSEFDCLVVRCCRLPCDTSGVPVRSTAVIVIILSGLWRTVRPPWWISAVIGLLIDAMAGLAVMWLGSRESWPSWMAASASLSSARHTLWSDALRLWGPGAFPRSGTWTASLFMPISTISGTSL